MSYVDEDELEVFLRRDLEGVTGERLFAALNEFTDGAAAPALQMSLRLSDDPLPREARLIEAVLGSEGSDAAAVEELFRYYNPNLDFVSVELDEIDDDYVSVEVNVGKIGDYAKAVCAQGRQGVVTASIDSLFQMDPDEGALVELINDEPELFTAYYNSRVDEDE